MLALMALLAACARPVGDLGRAEPDVLHDSVMPAMGRMAAEARGRPVSGFVLSDAEQLMADRMWRFLVPPHGSKRAARLAEWQRTGLTGPTDMRSWPADYYSWLIGTPYRSSTVRYSTLSADVEADLATLPDTFAAICAVEKTDRQRRIAAGAIAGLPSGTGADVAARTAENAALIRWFVRALAARHAAYSSALDRLIVETPDPAARPVDGVIADLAAWSAAAEAGRFCDGGRSEFSPRHGKRRAMKDPGR